MNKRTIVVSVWDGWRRAMRFRAAGAIMLACDGEGHVMVHRQNSHRNALPDNLNNDLQLIGTMIATAEDMLSMMEEKLPGLDVRGMAEEIYKESRNVLEKEPADAE